jgi:hypothetical protein
MSYDISDVAMYEWGQDQTFGSASVNHYIVGPRGKVGFVRDLLVDITTSLIGTVTVPEIQIGISSGDTTYGRYRLGTTITTGLPIGSYSASNEQIIGYPPRTATDFTSHVVLDGGPLTTAGVAGGTYLTVAPNGRIPASGNLVVNCVSGGSSHMRLFLAQPLPYNLAVGQLVNVRDVAGVTTSNVFNTAITALSTTANYIEIGTSFGGTYTGGGIVDFITVVTLLAGTGSSAGGGYARVKIQWVGANAP